jgi:uncharacterized protein YjbJ (UPF0337 family)
MPFFGNIAISDPRRRDFSAVGRERPAALTSFLHWIVTKERLMDREHIRGITDKAKGAVKDTAGKLTGDKKMQSEGKVDKAKGAAHNLAGDVKDAIRKGSE